MKFTNLDYCYWEISDASTDNKTLLRIMKGLIMYNGQLISNYKFGFANQRTGDFWRNEERLLVIIALPDGFESEFEHYTGLDLRPPLGSDSSVANYDCHYDH